MYFCGCADRFIKPLDYWIGRNISRTSSVYPGLESSPDSRGLGLGSTDPSSALSSIRTIVMAAIPDGISLHPPLPWLKWDGLKTRGTYRVLTAAISDDSNQLGVYLIDANQKKPAPPSRLEGPPNRSSQHLLLALTVDTEAIPKFQSQLKITKTATQKALSIGPSWLVNSQNALEIIRTHGHLNEVRKVPERGDNPPEGATALPSFLVDWRREHLLVSKEDTTGNYS
ncbi:hypothetical protein B0H13DRAFT_1936240 [Mycena leptocephala]|nr:hypothetical protein B0H13DRAFT_1936240 [Mycena leptocephala]